MSIIGSPCSVVSVVVVLHPCAAPAKARRADAAKKSRRDKLLCSMQQGLIIEVENRDEAWATIPMKTILSLRAVAGLALRAGCVQERGIYAAST